MEVVSMQLAVEWVKDVRRRRAERRLAMASTVTAFPKPSAPPSLLDTAAPPHAGEAVELFVRCLARGAVAGYSVQLAVQILKVLMRNPKTLPAALPRLLADPAVVGWAKFLAMWLAIFKTTMYLTRAHRVPPTVRDPDLDDATAATTTTAITTNSKKAAAVADDDESIDNDEDTATTPTPTPTPSSSSSSSWGWLRPAVSAGAASVALLHVPAGGRRAIAVAFFARALEVTLRYCTKTGLLPATNHVDTALMMAASAPVLWGYGSRADLVDPSYLKFLYMIGDKGPSAVAAMNQVFQGQKVSPQHLEKAKIALPAGVTAATASLCHVIHPGHTCTSHAAALLPGGIKRSVPVYLPVYLVPLALAPKAVLAKPQAAVRRAVEGVFWSSVFLTAYVAAFVAALCLFTRNGSGGKGVYTSPALMVAGMVGGSMVLLEKKSRRIELALYVTGQALPIVFAGLKEKGLARNVKDWEILLFGGSTAVIMMAHFRRPDVLRPSYRSLLRIALGV